MKEIEEFLEKVDLPLSKRPDEFYLKLHTSFREPLLSKMKKVSTFNGRFTRYRGFLLVFDEDIKISFMFIAFIFDEIENLKRLQADKSRFFYQKEFDTLNYLQHNRFIKD